MSDKRYDQFGQRMTDCCGDWATYGTNVDIYNLDSVQKTCVSCGKPTGDGEADQTEFRPGVTRDEWLRLVKESAIAERERKQGGKQ